MALPTELVAGAGERGGSTLDVVLYVLNALDSCRACYEVPSLLSR